MLWPLDILSEIMPHGRIWQRAYGRLQWRRWLGEFHRWAPDLIYINSVVALPIAADGAAARCPCTPPGA